MNINTKEAIGTFFVQGTAFYLLPGEFEHVYPRIELILPGPVTPTFRLDESYTLAAHTVQGDSPLGAPTPRSVWMDIRDRLDRLTDTLKLGRMRIGQLTTQLDGEFVIDYPPHDLNPK